MADMVVTDVSLRIVDVGEILPLLLGKEHIALMMNYGILS
jgi:hypothetical protein